MLMDYRPDYRSMGMYLKRSTALAGAVSLAAADVEIEARTIIEAEAYETGALASSLNIERNDWTDRICFLVQADDPAALPTEFGNAIMPPEEVVTFLVDAAQRVGLDVRDGE